MQNEPNSGQVQSCQAGKPDRPELLSLSGSSNGAEGDGQAIGRRILINRNFAACQGGSLPGTLTGAIEPAESLWKRAARLCRLRRLRREKTMRALQARAERAAAHSSGSWSRCHSRTETTEPRPALRKLDSLVDDSVVETVHRNGCPQVDIFFVLAGVVAR